LDCTDEPHPEAETLADRTQSKKGQDAPKVVGHRYSWLVRLVERRPSWCLPIDVSRVGSEQSDSQVAAEQVKVLDKQGSGLKAVVADSLYSNYIFLGVFLLVQTVVALVRLRSNQVLYEEPPARLAGQKGRPRKHGAKFKLSAPSRSPDRSSLERWLGQSVRLSAWHGLHLAKLLTLLAVVVRVEFLKADGTPRFKRPLFLFWSGPTSVPLFDLMRMYLWRFAIEHGCPLGVAFSNSTWDSTPVARPALNSMNAGSGVVPWPTANSCSCATTLPSTVRLGSVSWCKASCPNSPPDRCSAMLYPFCAPWAHRLFRPDLPEKARAGQMVIVLHRAHALP
jgi:hypothetical protein